jgi:two-component system NtrC family sensor kinase
LPDIELILELTGRDEVTEQIYKIIPPGIKVIDHTFARVFWDMGRAQRSQIRQLKQITALERELAAERYFLQSLVDKLPDMLLVLDGEQKVVKINAGFSDFMKISPQDVAGKKFMQIFIDTPYAANAAKSLKIIELILERREGMPIIWQAPAPQIIFWEVSHTPVLDESNQLKYILIVWHLITERIFLHRELESATTMFKSFIDSAQDWIAVKDMDGRYMAVNQVLADSYGLPREDFIGSKPEEVLPADVAGEISRHDRETLEDDSYHRFDEVVPIGGIDHYFQTGRFPRKDHTGRSIGICTIKRDVSKEKDLTDQLIRAEKMAEIGKLAAGVAHEINNPLTGILAFTEDVMSNLKEEDPIQEDMKVILRETMRCRSIVKNLLDFSRQEAPRLEEIDPNDVVEKTLVFVRRLPQFKEIDISVNLDENLPSISGDSNQLQQVILNLLANSAEAMKTMNKKGNIEIASSLDDSGKNCLITVKDDGPGVPDDVKDNLFRPFYSTKGSSGIGLAVCWGIIERHRGTIEVRNNELGGARFDIVLPCIKPI